MSSPTRVLLVITTAPVRWRIARGTPPILNAKLGQYTLVNPILNTEFDTQTSRIENMHHSSVYLPSNDEVVFSSHEIGLTVPPDANEKIDFDAIATDVAAFLIWLRSLSFQDQIPSTPQIVAALGASMEPLTTPVFPDLSNVGEARCRKYLVESCATEALVEEAARKVTTGERVPVHHHLLVDAFSAFKSCDYRQCLLYAAIAAEALAAGRLEQE